MKKKNYKTTTCYLNSNNECYKIKERLTLLRFFSLLPPVSLISTKEIKILALREVVGSKRSRLELIKLQPNVSLLVNKYMDVNIKCRSYYWKSVTRKSLTGREYYI